jgi:hypothetical protein
MRNDDDYFGTHRFETKSVNLRTFSIGVENVRVSADQLDLIARYLGQRNLPSLSSAPSHLGPAGVSWATGGLQESGEGYSEGGRDATPKFRAPAMPLPGAGSSS